MDNQQGFFSRKLRAGKKRSYFFDVRSTKQGDFFVTITESKRRYDRPGYDSHKIFLYKEDFAEFKDNLEETLNHIKTELNPDFDYDNYNRVVYNEQVEKEKAENPEKFKQERKSKPTSSRKESSLRTGDYLDNYDEGSESTEAPDLSKNDTSDAEAMDF